VVGSAYHSLIADSPDGTHQSAYANADMGFDYGFYQVLSAPLAANTTYTLTVDVGKVYGSGYPFGGTIGLGYGITQGLNFLTAATSNTPTPSVGNWATWTETFVTTSSPAGLGQALRIELRATSGSSQTLFDNVRLDAVTAPIPEPSTLVLLGAGLLGLLAYAWRKRK
jgi:hypothetical protein